MAEVEGDALFFYRTDTIPSVSELIVQAKNMFVAFHSHLKRYVAERICNCGACSTASGLTLKIIAHSGNMDFITIQNKTKPHGTDVILTHRLLKNSIAESEYLLITDPLVGKLNNDSILVEQNNLTLKSGRTTYDDLGEISYHFLSLTPFHSLIKELPPINLPPKVINPIRQNIEINANTKQVFNVVSDLDLRLTWTDGLDELVYEKNRVNRIGTKHVCLIGTKSIQFETITNDFGSEKIVYGERLLDFKLAKELYLYYIIEDNNNITNLMMECHIINRPIYGWIFSPFINRIMNKNIQKSLKAIRKICEKKNTGDEI